MDPKSTPKPAQNRGRKASPKGVPKKIDFGVVFGTIQNRSVFGPPLAMLGDLDFGPVRGSIWNPFWVHFGVKNRFESDWENYQKKTTKIVPKTAPKSIFFWTPFGDAWRPRFWAGFGVHLGSILEQFWGQRSV